MASTTFTITTPQALSGDVLHRWEDALLALVSPHPDFSLSTEVVEPKRTVRIKQENYPRNPRREFDHVGVMFCKHRRYDLGDRGAENPIRKYGYIDIGGYKLYDVGSRWDETDDPPDSYTMYDDVIDLLCEHRDSYDEDSADYAAIDDTIEWLRAHEWQTEDVEDEDIALCLPIYAYEHGGITVSHGSFSCRWDSGQVGWHYITKQAADAAWGEGKWTEDTLRACLKAELEEYDHYLQGNVWRFEIEDENGDVVDSCGGFYGDDLDKTGILEHIDKELHDAAREAWSNRFD